MGSGVGEGMIIALIFSLAFLSHSSSLLWLGGSGVQAIRYMVINSKITQTINPSVIELGSKMSAKAKNDNRSKVSEWISGFMAGLPALIWCQIMSSAALMPIRLRQVLVMVIIHKTSENVGYFGGKMKKQTMTGQGAKIAVILPKKKQFLPVNSWNWIVFL